ncbi:collagen binding domain-containing protein [Paenibacillus rhizoplanae]
MESGSIGDYTVGTDNKVVLTFNSEIEGLFDVGGTFNVTSKLSSTKVTGTTTQELLFPIAGNLNNTIVIKVHPKGGTSITKDGIPQPQKYNPSSILWTVDVNTVQDEVYKAVVTDSLPAGLELDPSSIEVYKLAVDVQGNTSQGAQIGSDQYDASGSTASSLNVKFNNTIKDAYRVKFSTKITDTSVKKISLIPLHLLVKESIRVLQRRLILCGEHRWRRLPESSMRVMKPFLGKSDSTIMNRLLQLPMLY